MAKKVTRWVTMNIMTENMMSVDVGRLHFQDEITSLHICILRIEHAAVAIKSTTNLVPA